MIAIDKFGNLILRVYEPVKKNKNEEDQQEEEANLDDSSIRASQVEEFKVCRSTLMEHSPVFKALLSPGRFAEGEKDTVTLKEDHIISMEILLRVVHDTDLQSTFETPLEEMWPLVLTLEKYDLDISIFQEWFEKWYDSAKPDLSEVSVAASLLYPCYIFSNAPAFASATRALTYRAVGHIMEINPTKYKELHLPSRVIRESSHAQNFFVV